MLYNSPDGHQPRPSFQIYNAKDPGKHLKPLLICVDAGKDKPYKKVMLKKIFEADDEDSEVYRVATS